MVSDGIGLSRQTFHQHMFKDASENLAWAICSGSESLRIPFWRVGSRANDKVKPFLLGDTESQTIRVKFIE